MSTTTATATQKVTKTYILLEALDVDAPIYQTIPGSKQRSQIKKIPWHRPYLQLSVTDAQGVSRMLRYKQNSKHLFQDDQMEKEKLDANVKFTDSERNETYFRHGILVTDKLRLQEFLEANPEFDKSPYTSESVARKTYKLLDKDAEDLDKNTDLKKRVKAANKILATDLEGAKEMIIRLNGSFVKTPTSLEGCQNKLMEFLDDAEEEGMDAILKEDKLVTVDEKTTVLIGSLINAELLSFDAETGSISKKAKDNKWMPVREISTEYSLEVRMQMFSDFLNTADGKALKEDLEKDLETFKKADKKKNNSSS